MRRRIRLKQFVKLLNDVLDLDTLATDRVDGGPHLVGDRCVYLRQQLLISIIYQNLISHVDHL